MLTVEGLNQYYGGSHILRDVSLSMTRGRCLAVLGRNGVGKTTLLKCLMGLLPIASGSVAFEGRDLRRLAPHARARLGLGYVPQGREVFPRLSVEENLSLALAARNGGGARAVPAEVYELFPALKDMRRRRGGDLSGGQQQQLAIARALVTEPKLLILDEPTEGIQPSIIKDIERVIRLLTQRGDMAILLVEQYYDFAHALADEYLVLSRGEVVKRGGRDDMDAAQLKHYLAL